MERVANLSGKGLLTMQNELITARKRSLGQGNVLHLSVNLFTRWGGGLPPIG